MLRMRNVFLVKKNKSAQFHFYHVILYDRSIISDLYKGISSPR